MTPAIELLDSPRVRSCLQPPLTSSGTVQPCRFYFRYGKRCFDVAASIMGLLLLAIPMCLIALLVLITDGRPVLFRQRRVGRYGQPFRIAKFRTMTNRPLPGSPVTIPGDARVTRLGKWLRKLKLDELPQLLNVLVGDMSLVGPRPDVPGYMDRLEGEAARLLELRPGITGLASLAFRNEEQVLAGAKDPIAYHDQVIFPEKVRLNLGYYERLSFRQDLALIVRTLLPDPGA